MNIYEKLALVQKKLVAPKGQRNDFGKFNYRSCEDILVALKPILDEVKATVILDGGEMVNLGDRYYVKVTADFVDLDTGEKITRTAMSREAEHKSGMDDSQVSGANLSYCRKYLLSGMMLIDNEKDADTNEMTQKRKEADETEKIGRQKIGKNKIETLQTMIDRDGVDLPLFLNLCKVKALDDITENVFVNVTAHWDEVKAKCPAANEVFK